MRLPKHVHVRQWDLHAWFGVVVGLLFYVMAFAGSLTLMRPALQVWEEPVAQTAATEQQLHAAIGTALSAFEESKEVIFILPRLQSGAVKVLGPGSKRWTLDVATGELVPERVHVAELLLDLHYFAIRPFRTIGTKTAGFVCVGVLMILVSGLIIQLKNLVKQLHQFRPEKPFRFAASDLHKVLGVVGLPFQLFYPYTGALILFAAYALPLSRPTAFDGRNDVAQATVKTPPFRGPKDPGPASPMLSPSRLIEVANEQIPGLDVLRLKYRHYGRVGADVQVVGVRPSGEETDVTLSPADGRVLKPPAAGTAFESTDRWALSLHLAHYGGWPLRFVSFVLGICTCLTILTGNWIWLERRDPLRRALGNRVLERLTLAFAAGLLIALGSIMITNRVVPFELAGRDKIEVLAFWGAWLASCVWALLAKDVAKAWKQQLLVAAGLLVTLPLLSLRVSTAGLFGTQPVGEVVGVEIAQLLMAGGLVFVAWKIRGSRRSSGIANDRDGDSVPQERLA